MKRSIAVLSFLLWTGIVVSAYYVVQKPGLFGAFAGLANTMWTLIVAALLLFNAYGIGRQILAWIGLTASDELERLLLGTGVGLGGLGLLGLIVSLLRIAHPPVFFLLLLVATVFFILNKDAARLRLDLAAFRAHLNLSFSRFGLLSKLAILLPFAFSFLLTLAPQFEAFDALLYHLAQPARVLQDGGVRLVNIPHFWFPNLTENLYLLALGLGSERAAQLMHFTWGTLAALLLWHWAVKVWDVEIGRKTLLLLVAVPSLPMLASWAYGDLALVFYALAVLYALTSFQATKSSAWLFTAGMLAGLAMAVKYTSFTVPLSAGLLLLFWRREHLATALTDAARFGMVALLVALPWYARNAVMMGNPFYPFVFGGQYWDAFRAEWYAAPGTGIGWDPIQIILLPLNVLLGHRDANFFDGRIGPLFLILAPFAWWTVLSRADRDSERGLSLQAIGLFSAISFAAWTLGVISSGALWQARLLFPALIPFAIPTALGWESLRSFDTPRLRISFLASVVIAVIIGLTVFDNAVFMLQRNPLAFAVGAQSREGYIARVNPSYAALIQISDRLPEEARLYSLFEPRSYSLSRPVQPDPINDNFYHDLHLYHTTSGILEHWKLQGYTHVVVYERGLSFITENPSSQIVAEGQDALYQTLGRLEPVEQTADGVYSIYRIP